MSRPDFFTVTISLPVTSDLALLYAHLQRYAEHERLGLAVMPNGLDFHLREAMVPRREGVVVPLRPRELIPLTKAPVLPAEGG